MASDSRSGTFIALKETGPGPTVENGITLMISSQPENTGGCYRHSIQSEIGIHHSVIIRLYVPFVDR